MLYSLAVALYVLTCLFLIGVVLLQPGQASRSGGGGVFGAGSSTGSVFGGRGASTVLSRATTLAAAGFMILSIVLARAGSDRSSVEAAAQNVLTSKVAPKADDKAPAADPAQPAVPAPAPAAAPAPAP